MRTRLRTPFSVGTLTALMAAAVLVLAPAGYGQESDDQSVIQFINQQIRQGWDDNEIKPSPAATDGEWVRRVYLDVLGRIPTYAETQSFVRDASETKKADLVEKLLYSETYEMELANYWSTIWTNLLIGRAGDDEQEDRPVNRPGLEKFTRDAYLRNMPYDRFVLELIGGDGNNTPGEPDFNGAVNFLLDNLQDDQVPATNKVTQLFLGMRVGCTQCHNHPFNEWKQDAFWSMNAFFKQARPLRSFEGRDVVSAELADEDFAGQDGNPDEAATFYELRNGLVKVAYPRFVDGTAISPVGYVNEVNRRDELAKLIVESPAMKEALVNRMWGQFFGYGFTKPVDDMGPHNPPSHPELLSYLAEQFATGGFDMRRLMRWYLLSEPYSLSSRITRANAIDDPTKGEVPLFSHYYTRQFSAEQLYGSLMSVSQADRTASSVEEQNRIRNEWLQQFAINFGTDENDEATIFNGTIPQALMMMNGEQIQMATSTEPGSFLYDVTQQARGPQEQIEIMFQAALSRGPSKGELGQANKLLVLRKGNTLEALQDVFWAVLNSNEFIINH